MSQTCAKSALLVTGGSIEDAFVLDYIRTRAYDVTFAVDHGLEFFARNELKPDYIVGDFDSVAPGGLEKYQEADAKVVRLNPQKDDTDTEHALAMALEQGCQVIHIFGGTGSRIDHVLGNLQLLGYGLRADAECVLLDPYNRIRLINQDTVISRREQFGKYVSLIPYTPRVTGLTLEGFAYPLKDHTMSSFYLEDAAPISGISNEIISPEAKISLKEGILVLVESRDSVAEG